MALIKCPECGKEISDLASNCPNCGFPIGFDGGKRTESNVQYQQNTAPRPNNSYQQNNTYHPNMATQPIHAYIHKPNKSLGISIGTAVFAVLGSVILMIVILTAIVNGKSSKENANEVETVAESHTDEHKIEDNINTNSQEKTSDDIIEYNKSNTQDIINESVNQAKKEPFIDVFFYTLIDNIDDYNGKNIRTVIEVDRCYGTDEMPHIVSAYTDYDFCEKLNNIIIYPDNYQEFPEGEYITIEGKVAKDGNSDVIANAHIVEYGEDSEKNFNEELEFFKEQREERLKAEKETFIEEATTPTYDDLLRYPDSYKEIKIKANVKIVRVEPDGIIFDGDIEATLSGETIALYDGRTTKEPKLREGDSVTIYGYGKGTTTVKVQDVSGILPKTVDKYDIPAIDIRYIDF